MGVQWGSILLVPWPFSTQTCTTLGLAPSCYSPTSADPVDMFNKLEDDGTALSQDLEELQEDLRLLMEKHGVAGPSDGWEENFYLPMGWNGDCGFIEPEVSLEIQDPKAGLMFLSPILSRPTEIMMLFSLYLDTLLDPFQLNPWPPDSLHQCPLTFTCATMIAVQGFPVLYGTTSYCRLENTSLDPAEGRPYLGPWCTA